MAFHVEPKTRQRQGSVTPATSSTGPAAQTAPPPHGPVYAQMPAPYGWPGPMFHGYHGYYPGPSFAPPPGPFLAQNTIPPNAGPNPTGNDPIDLSNITNAPMIRDFLTDLAAKPENKLRKLMPVIETLESHGFWQIDEIAQDRVSEDRLCQIGIPIGTVQFIRRRVEKALRESA